MSKKKPSKQSAARSKPKTQTKSRATAQKKESDVAPPEESTTAPVQSSSKATSTVSISADERRKMIEETAYYIAEARGFASGDDATDRLATDWAEAERKVDALIEAEGHALTA